MSQSVSTTFLMPFVIGIILTVVMLFVSHATGLFKSRGVYPTTLMAIAIFYVVFAVEQGSQNDLIFNVLVSGVFITAALMGYMKTLWYVVAGFAGHGIFDVVYHYYPGNPAPDWWAPLCLAADLLLALALAGWITADKTGELK